MNLGSRKNSKTKHSSYRRQNSANELGFRHKERGSSAHVRNHVRPQSAKDPNLKSDDSRYKNFSSNWDYKNPEEFHKLRHSLAHKKQKSRRPSSAKRKDENSLKENSKNLISTPEFKYTSQLKSSTIEKNSFLDNVASKETGTRPSRNSDNRYSQLFSSREQEKIIFKR